MEPIYGIHLGLVVSDNPDPEGRNRVQVWIPHLSTTLYDSINQKMVDLNIKSPGDLPSDALVKLRKILPWAEYAAPLFGGSSGNFNYSTGKTATTSSSTLPNTTGIPTPTKTTNTPDMTLQGNIPLGNTIGNSVVNKSLNVPSSLLNDSEFQSTLNGYIQKYPGLTADQIYAIMQGESGYNTNTRTGSYVGLFQLKPGEGGAPDATSIISASPSQQLSWYMNYLSSSGYNGSQPIALYQAAPGYMQQGYTKAGDSMNDINTIIFPAGSIEANSNPGWRDSNGNVTVGSVQNYYYGVGNNIANNTNYNQIDIGKSGKSPVKYPSQNANQNVAANLGTAGSAVGSFATPNAGSKVWVFFIGGDIQRPAYFAQAINTGDMKAYVGG